MFSMWPHVYGQPTITPTVTAEWSIPTPWTTTMDFPFFLFEVFHILGPGCRDFLPSSHKSISVFQTDKTESLTSTNCAPQLEYCSLKYWVVLPFQASKMSLN